jgi:phage terminase small subunit
MPGRRPRPSTALALEKGTLYGDQKDRAESEPQAVVVVEPSCPPYFQHEEKEAWSQIAQILRNYNLFLDVNAIPLELASMQLALVRNSKWEIIRRGKTIKGPNGENWRNPAIKDLFKSTELLIKLCSALNLSAGDMARLGANIVKGKKAKSEMEDLLD